MKKIILLAVFAVAAFAQRNGGGHFGGGGHFSAPSQHFSQRPMSSQGFNRFGSPGFNNQSGFRSFRFRPIIVRPGFGFFGGFGWTNYYSLGFWPYYYPYDTYGVPAYQAQPCKKESLRDSDGTKHQVLLCVQSDGTYKLVADGNNLIAVPKEEVKQ